MNVNIPKRSDKDVNVFVLVKGSERYVFLYHDPQKPELLQQIARFAERADLSFTWHDASVLRQRIKETAEEIF